MASTPPPSYTKLADLTGDRTFQTVGIQYVTGPGVNFTQTQTLSGTSGIKLAYTASTDTYVVTAADGSSATFTPADVQAPTANTPPDAQVWRKVNGTQVDNLQIRAPQVGGTSLSYVAFGSWGRLDTATGISTNRLGVGGANTVASDMPRSGSASYATVVAGIIEQAGKPYKLDPSSTATFTANFGQGSVATALTLSGTQFGTTNPALTDFGVYNGNGTISGNAFTGSLTGPAASGSFIGGFFGPQGSEMAYDWFVNGTSLNGVGNVAGRKQ